jgi:hypothetical protein
MYIKYMLCSAFSQSPLLYILAFVVRDLGGCILNFKMFAIDNSASPSSEPPEEQCEMLMVDFYSPSSLGREEIEPLLSCLVANKQYKRIYIEER